MFCAFFCVCFFPSCFSFNLLPVRFRVGFLFFGPTLLCICSYLSQLNIVAGARVACLCCFLFVVLHQQDNSLHSACIRSSALCMSFVFTLFFSTSFWSSFFSFFFSGCCCCCFFFNLFHQLFIFIFFLSFYIPFRVCASIFFPVCFLCLVNYFFFMCVWYGAMGRSAPALDERRHKSLLFKHIFEPLHLFSLFTFN